MNDCEIELDKKAIEKTYLNLEAVGDFDVDILPFSFIRKYPDPATTAAGAKTAQVSKVHALVSGHFPTSCVFTAAGYFFLSNPTYFPAPEQLTLAFHDPFSLS